jgi:uncharacterized protein YidB (DUF937 family)
MSLMDSLLGALGGAAGGAGAQQPAMNPLLQIALQLLAGGGGAGGAGGGGSAGGLGSLGSLGGLAASLGGGGSGAGGAGPQGLGGLGDLLAAFERNGMGEQVQSWVGTGSNLPLAPEQLQQALGGDMLDGLARQAGVSPAEAGSGLAELLPQLIDRLTPDGQLPQAGGLGDLGSILGALTGRRG